MVVCGGGGGGRSGWERERILLLASCFTEHTLAKVAPGHVGCAVKMVTVCDFSPGLLCPPKGTGKYPEIVLLVSAFFLPPA